MSNFIINKYYEKENNLIKMNFVIGLKEELNTNSTFIKLEGKNKKINVLDFYKYSNNFIYSVFIELDSTNKTQKYNYVFKNLSGSFKIFSANEHKIKFGFVSCNDNDSKNLSEKWKKYNFPGKSLWKKTKNEKFDIIIHLGDQVYADDIYNLFINAKSKKEITNVKNKLFDLYISSYLDLDQSYTMRNCLNFGLCDDHEFVNGFGTPTFKEKNYINDKYLSFMKENLMIISLIPKDIINKKLFSYNINVGIFNIILLDTRLSFYYYKTRFSNEIINYTKRNLKKGNKNLIILPSPLYHYSNLVSNIGGYFYSDIADSSTSKYNYENSEKFKKILFNSDANFIKIISGDIHKTFIQDHKDPNSNRIINELVTSGISSRTIGDENIFYKLINLFGEFISFDSFYNVKNRRNYSLYNNYGILENGTLSNRYNKNSSFFNDENTLALLIIFNGIIFTNYYCK